MKFEHVYRRVDNQQLYISEIASAFQKLISVGKSNVFRNRIEVRLNSLNKAWHAFATGDQAIRLSIPLLPPSDQSRIERRSYFREDLYTVTQENYLEALEKIQDLKDSLSHQHEAASSSLSRVSIPSTIAAASNHSMHHAPRLPRLDVPKFNGMLDDWLSWKGLFTSLVLNNASLSPAEKLQYLKVSLISAAAHLLKNTSITNENFEPAFNAVITYYENERRLVHAALQSLFNARAMTRESAADMEKLYTSFEQACRTLEALKRPIGQCDDFLVYLITQKLDPDSMKAWELNQGSSKRPATWQQMREFLTTRIGSLQAFENAQPSKGSKQWTFRPLHQSARAYHTSTDAEDKQTEDTTCPMCSGNHFLSYCSQFTRLSTKQRHELVLKKNLCFNCLRPHRLAQCRSTRRCTKCGKRHHTTIHQQHQAKSSTVATIIGGDNVETDQPDSVKQVNQTNIRNHLSTISAVLLATAQVKIIGNHGESVMARALLDQGSEISLVTENLVQRLCLKRSPSTLSIIGVGAAGSNKTKGQVKIEVQPHFQSDTTINVNAHILTKLTACLPTTPLQQLAWPHVENLRLADPHYFKPGPIDLLIGADIYGQLLEGSVIKGKCDAPVAQLTSLGWIISGPTPMYAAKLRRVHRLCFRPGLEFNIREVLAYGRTPHQQQANDVTIRPRM